MSQEIRDKLTVCTQKIRLLVKDILDADLTDFGRGILEQAMETLEQERLELKAKLKEKGSESGELNPNEESDCGDDSHRD